MLWLGPPPLLQTFVAGLLLQTLVADLCVEYCSLQGACRGGVCCRTPRSVTSLCREMAAQACYKANAFDSLLFELYDTFALLAIWDHNVGNDGGPTLYELLSIFLVDPKDMHSWYSNGRR